MKTIEFRGLGDYLFENTRARFERPSEYLRGTSFFYSRRSWFEAFPLCCLLLLILTLLAFFHHFCFLLLLAFSMVLLGLFLATKTVADSLAIERRVANLRVREFDLVDVAIEIQNLSEFPCGPMVIEDLFLAAQNPEVLLGHEEIIRPLNSTILRYQKVCDGGMGRHSLGPLLVVLSDPLGIFEFKIRIDLKIEIDVAPKIENISQLPMRGTPRSDHYGIYDVAARGTNINFAGIREHTYGDSLRFVAWKLSAKKGQLLIKEFEKSVNTEVTVYLNLDADAHIGFRSHSTWEMGRDVALSVFSQQAELGNSLRLITQHLTLGPDRGESFLYLLKETVRQLKPSPVDSGTNTNSLSKILRDMKEGSTFVYVTPFRFESFADELKILRSFRAQGVQVICILIDTSLFISEVVGRVESPLLMRSLRAEDFDSALFQLRSSGVMTYVVADVKNFARHMVEGAR